MSFRLSTHAVQDLRCSCSWFSGCFWFLGCFRVLRVLEILRACRVFRVFRAAPSVPRSACTRALLS